MKNLIFFLSSALLILLMVAYLFVERSSPKKPRPSDKAPPPPEETVIRNQQEIHFHDATPSLGVGACGTPDFGPDMMRRIMDIDEKKKKRRRDLKRKDPVVTPVVISTYFIIITDSNDEDNVTDAQVADQLVYLNQSFAASGSIFRFTSAAPPQRVKIVNAATTSLQGYFLQLIPLHKGGLNALNVFVVPFVGLTSTNQTSLGVATPFFFGFIPELDAVAIQTGTLKNGYDTDYNFGSNCVHEVGHWLGLSHVYQAVTPYETDPCNRNNPNDFIDDTAQMATYTPLLEGCRRLDTCPKRPGRDPLNNFMDAPRNYDDVALKRCPPSFTPQQVQRMEDVWYFFRVNNEICALDELQLNITLRFDSYPNETSWTITRSDGLLVHNSLQDSFGRPYQVLTAGRTWTLNECLPRDQYYFTIFDVAGNGIQAPGFYLIGVDGQVVGQGGQDFTTKAVVPFGSPTRRPKGKKGGVMKRGAAKGTKGGKKGK